MVKKEVLKGACRGQVTVFLSLTLTLVLTLILTVFDAARIQCTMVNQKEAVMTACENLLAGYCIPLRERYDLFGIDGNGRDLTASLADYISENDGEGLFSGEMDGAVISKLYELTEGDDENADLAMINEILAYMKTAGLIETAMEMMSDCVSSDTEDADNTKSDIASQIEQNDKQAQKLKAAYEAEKANETDSESQTGEDEKVTQPAQVKDPRKSVGDMLKKGMLSLVVPKDRAISERKTDADLRSEGKAGTLTDFFNVGSVTDKLENFRFSIGDIGDSMTQKSVLLLYLRQHFKSFTRQSEIPYDTCLQYEMEALLCGHSSDTDNLLDSANRLAMFRMLFNFSYLLSNASKSAQAHSAAASLAAFLLAPYLEGIFYMLILLVWAYAEAVVDVRTLLDGGKVGLIKTDLTWQLSIENLMNISDSTIDKSCKSSDRGLSYDDYLFTLLMISNQGKIQERMISLMQENIRLEDGYENFDMNDCYYGLTCIAEFTNMGFYAHKSFQYQWTQCY